MEIEDIKQQIQDLEKQETQMFDAEDFSKESLKFKYFNSLKIITLYKELIKIYELHKN